MPKTIVDFTTLQTNRNVCYATRHRLVLKTEFRARLFKLWKNGEGSRIPAILTNAGLGTDVVGVEYLRQLLTDFKDYGYPLFMKWELELSPELYRSNPLLASGKFVLQETKKDIKLVISDDLKTEILSAYPAVTVVEGLTNAGVDPLDVGTKRIRDIAKELDQLNLDLIRKAAEERATDSTVPESMESSDDTESPEKSEPEQKKRGRPRKNAEPPLNVDAYVEEILTHPYVKSFDGEKITLKDAFYNETIYISALGIEKILEIYDFKPYWFSVNNMISISARLQRWIPDDNDNAVTMYDTRIADIWRRKIEAMEKVLLKCFDGIKQKMNVMSSDEKRTIARWIDKLPRDPWGVYTTKKILELIGINKSVYYQLLSNENYGKGVLRRQIRDDEDIRLIRQVADYKGYKKGYRQISMLMNHVTGVEMSPHRVQMLMRRYGMNTGIRPPVKNRKAMKELVERNGKPNIINRKFKLYRPNEVRLTDVTYLYYGDGMLAYGSASIDPVTGRVICFVVRERNDLQLALDTLEKMDSFPAVNGGIIHSDQGVLYFTDDFQNAVKDRKLVQSMSRRGNCWDNAPVESFFGHFKDECDYSHCLCFRELKRCIEDYRVYYNYERCMWNRLKMTPVQYEAYLCGLSDKEFKEHISREKKRYTEMREKAAEKVIAKATAEKKARAAAEMGGEDETD